MANDEQTLEGVEKTGNNLPEAVKVKKSPVEKRAVKLDKINCELAGFSDNNGSNIEEIEAQRNFEFKNKMQEMGMAGIPVSEDMKKTIYQNMVDDAIEHARKENQRFDELKIEKIVLENAGNPEAKLMKRLFGRKSAQSSEDVFYGALEKLCETEMKTSKGERIKIFREALEYFSEEEKIEYPIAHATGSDSLRLIIADGAIKEGGTGEHGEAAGQSRGGRQDGVSVAEMDHDMADYVGMFYGRMAANKEITKNILEIDADLVDSKTILEDIADVFLDFIAVDKFLDAASERTGKDVNYLRQRLAKESGKNPEDVESADIRKSETMREMLFGSMEKMANRKHYMTAERSKRDYEALDHIIRICEGCKNGEFPKIEFKGKTYQDPDEIIELKHGIYELEDHDSVEKKVFIEMQSEYSYLLKPYWDDNTGKWIEPRYSKEELRLKSGEILGEYAKWIKEGSTLETLLSLHQLESDSEEVRNKKLERLRELDSQYPCMLVIEGDEYRKKGLTHSAKKGSKPVPFFEVEERIMADVSLVDIKEVVVPRAKINEVRAWLEDSGIREEDIPRMVAFEYFEVKRLLNHQLAKEN